MESKSNDDFFRLLVEGEEITSEPAIKPEGGYYYVYESEPKYDQGEVDIIHLYNGIFS